jgi:ComF family protein
MKAVLKDVLELFYPRTCNGCGKPLFKGEEIICLPCKIKLPRTEFNFHAENPVEKLFWGRLPVLHATSFLYYRKSGIAQRLIHQLKYKEKKEIGYYLGYLYGQETKQGFLSTGPDLITTVPLHPKKFTHRGFNQSDEIARGFSDATGIPFLAGVVSRNEATETQTRRKRYQRWENMEEKFELVDTEHTRGKHIVLFDDVITTGATMEACGRSLLSSPGSSISLLSLCFAIN